MGDGAKKTLRIFAYLAGLVVILKFVLILAAAAALIWMYRSPKSAFELAEKYILPPDMTITWAATDLHARPVGWFAFSFDLSLEDLRITKESPALDVPIAHAHLRATVFPFKRKMTVELFEVRSSLPMTYKAAPEPSKRDSDPFEQIQSAIRTLKLLREHIAVDAADVEIKQLVVQRAIAEPITVSLRLTKAKSEAAYFTFQTGIPPALQISAQGKIDSENSAMTISTDGDIRYRKAKTHLKIKPKLAILLSGEDTTVELGFGLKGIPGPLAEVTDVHAKMHTSFATGAKWKASLFSIAAPIRLFFVSKPNRAAVERACSCKLPETLEVKVDGSLFLAGLLSKPSDPRSKILDSVISIETLKNKILELDLKGGLSVETEAGKYLYYPRLDCSATVKSLKAVKTVLDVNGIVVPAPFDVMDGTLKLSSAGPVKSDAKGSNFPLVLSIDLDSSTQKVKAETNADVSVNSRLTEAHLDVRAKIASLVLDLPPLKPLDGLPRIATDSRFKKAPPTRPTSPKFKFFFNFEIETESKDAIRLKSEYFVPDLPISLKIQSSAGRENTGFIALRPFDITYLRRTVHVEYLTLTLSGSENEPMPVKGRLRVKQTEYTIFIDIEGDTKHPAVVFSSEPYLPKNEIIHVLLFDRRSDLQSGEIETSGSVQAAIADRAIGLFGIWAFASTPIRGFSYNPVTKVYTATIAVSNDLIASIGTGWESATQLELRKRVSKNWSLTAAWTPATQDEKDTAKLVLQWEKRF